MLRKQLLDGSSRGRIVAILQRGGLTADEMARISALKRSDGRIANPKGRAPAWD